MEESLSSTAGMNCNVYLDKKRKSQDELIGMPLTKHVCWGQRLDHDSWSGSSMRPEMMDFNLVATGHESELESVKDSNSTDSAMSMSDEPKIDQSHRKTFASGETSTSSVSWGGTYSGVDIYSLESRSLAKSTSVNSESLSQSCSDHGYVQPPLNYEDHFLECGYDTDFCYSEYKNCEDIEPCQDEVLDNMLYSNDVAPTNYILSSGRWSVHQEESQRGARKLTIDKEFEKYFSTLML